MKTVVRARELGWIARPDEIRDDLGIKENCLLRITVQDGEVRIEPFGAEEGAQGSPWLRELYESFAPVREEIEAKGYSEEDVNAAIDEALREVRAENPDSW